MALTRNQWHETCGEGKRTYFYGGDKSITVLNVERFKVSTNGRHYLQKANGKYMIMQKGWLAIKVDGELVAS